MMRILLLLFATLLTSAHVGDNNTYFRGRAGPHAVQVTVRHPGVVPGLAEVLIRVDGDVRGVTVQPVKTSMGAAGAPRPDAATPVPGAPGLYSAELWFMEAGAYRVIVAVDGATVDVPVSSMATERLGVSRGLGVMLIALGLFLAIGLITIVRAAIRESVLPPGAEPTPQLVRRGRIATAASTVVVGLVLWGGAGWWRAEDGVYAANMWQPMRVQASATNGSLSIAVLDTSWIRESPVIPDHGKMMHLFAVRIPQMDVFAHLHPAAVHSDTFRAALPSLPAGRYALYGDIVHESGFAQTVTDTVQLDGSPATVPADADDSWWPREAAVATSPDTVTLEDGTRISWDRPGSIAAGEELELRFDVRNADGSPALLEMYMGMAAHAAVRKDDGSVFVHLHPAGSIAMAAQPAADTTLHTMHGAAPQLTMSGPVTIPYGFPQPGRYRMWLQLRVAASVRTTAWDVDVR